MTSLWCIGTQAESTEVHVGIQCELLLYHLLLPQLQQKLLLLYQSQTFLMSVILMMMTMLQILPSRLFIKKPLVHSSLSQMGHMYQLKSSKNI